MSAPWITFRPELKVLDCTIRDGGLVNDHAFDDAVVRAVYHTCVEAGIDYMELGYKASKKLFAPSRFGDWKFCDEDDMRRIVGDNDTSLKLAAMADAEKTDYHEDILPKSRSVLDVIRVATYVHQIPVAVDMIEDAADKGYEVTCNLMAVSVLQEAEIDQALEVLRDTPVSTVVVVDSFGSLYGEQVARLVERYRAALDGTGKEVGIHAHNNQQLAFANTIEAIIRGANRLDATMAGMKIGTMIRITTMGSTNIQPTKNAIEMTIRTPIGPISVIPIPSRMAWGICAKEMTQENAAPAATRMNTTAVIKPVDLAIE